mmetsp:Transcript_117302/g.163221  ORF Transcript_117302/g.163221 Transcript_117302/m.163221 type:complete len:129 (-) Transcript_117302:1931-2317(-)
MPAADQTCTKYFNSNAFTSDLTAACQGEKNCTLGNLSSYNQWGAPAGCFNQQTMIFVQAACTYSDDELSTRQVFGLYNACMGVFISLFIIVYVDYIRSVQSNNYVEWDVKTITAGDYSVEFDIPESFY